jgi:hypothetical protein
VVPLCWVGVDLAGLRLTTILRRGAFATFVYGDCVAVTRGCAPLGIESVRMCRAHVPVPPLAGRTVRRGVASGGRGGALVLVGDRRDIRVFARGGLGHRSIAALAGLDDPARQTGPG